MKAKTKKQAPRPARRSPSIRRNKPDRRYHVQRQHGDQHGERRQVSQEVFLDRVKESCKTRIADAEKEFDKRLDSLGEDVRASVVWPACQKHGLEFQSGNGDFWFEKNGERLDRTEPHGAPGRVAMVKMGLESVFAVLELEIVGGDFLGFHVASVHTEDLSKETLRTKWDVEVQLHELAHVIVQPPWWPMVDVPEELLLMQFERSLARVALDNKSLRRTIAWQHETEVSVFCSMLEELEGYERSGFWRLGFRLCRMLGILDARRRPTWRWPDWQKLEPYKASLERYIDERGQTLPLVKNAVA